MAVEILGPVISEGRAVTRSTWCMQHNRICTVKTAKRHIAGTSCRPFSKKGMRLGLLDCEVVILLSWIAMRVELQEADILQENVAGSDISLLKRFLGHLYHIDIWVGDPIFFGWPFARECQFVRLRHRTKVLAELSPMSRFVKRFWRAISFQWEQVYCNINKGVIPDELNEELGWAQSRPTSQ